MLSPSSALRVIRAGFAFALLGAVVQTGAQTSQKSDPSADLAWSNLSKVANPVLAGDQSGNNGNAKNNGKKTADESAAATQQKVATLKTTAQSARDFYTAFPTDPRAPQAKKLEVTSSLQTISPQDADRGASVLQKAAEYRADLKNSAKDRFEVASLMEWKKYSTQNNGKSLSSNSSQHEKVADSLRTEFGDIPEVYSFYLGVVNTADFEAARRVAQKVVQLPAPSYAKAEAQVTLDRYALLGKRRDESFRADDGHSATLGAAGKTTIVVVWSARQAESTFAALGAYKKIVPADARWIYVSVAARAGPFNLAKTQAPFPGTHVFDSPGGEGPIASLLKIRRTPFVYLLDRTGALVGYGSISELPDLLKLGSR